MTTPGDLIRAARERAGISQQQLADRIGTQQSAISRLEHGKVSPGVNTLERILGAAGSRLVIAEHPIGDQHAPPES